MINRENLTKQIRLVTQQAWTVGTNTTINDMIEYIVRETLFLVLPEIENELQTLKDQIKDVSKERRLSQPQRDREATDKRNKITKAPDGLASHA